MIKYIEGNIFDSPAQVIVNTVNTVGVMGKGLALAFKQRYPDMFLKYREACEKHQLSIGQLMLIYEEDHWLLLFPTKENWRNPSKLEYIEKGLMKFVDTYAQKKISSVAFPRLGCGNGELSWGDVKPLMEMYLSKLPIDVYIYLGPGKDLVPEHKQQNQTLAWLKQNAKDMSYLGVKDEISHLSAILPYSYEYKGSVAEVQYDHGLSIKYSDEQYEIEEDDFFEIWDRIRKDSVIAEGDNLAYALVYALLADLGYLSPVRINDYRAGIQIFGYQINEGMGRVYSFEGGQG